LKPEVKALSYAGSDFKFLNKDQQIQITLIDHDPMGRHLVSVLCYLAGRIASPVGAYVITITIFRSGSKFRRFSEEPHRYESVIVWRIKSYMAACGQI
jgi:hypothetical protein